MGKSSDEGVKAAKAGMCAFGLCCALCIGIPLLICIIIIIVIVVVVSSAADTITEGTSCDTVESGSCFFYSDCKGTRSCGTDSTCTGDSGCWAAFKEAHRRAKLGSDERSRERVNNKQTKMRRTLRWNYIPRLKSYCLSLMTLFLNFPANCIF